jgi:hypothetical protein
MYTETHMSAGFTQQRAAQQVGYCEIGSSDAWQLIVHGI